MKGNRRTLVLLALLIAAAGYYAWIVLSDGGGSGGIGASGRSAQVARRDVGVEIESLATGLLEHKPSVYRQGRDLFRYGEAPRPEPPPQPVTPPPPSQPEPEPEPKATAPPKPQPPPIDVVYLGSFGRPGRRIAVFTDDEAVYNARVGDVIKEKFVLVTIGYESADLGFTGFPEVSPRRLAAGGLR